MPGWRRVEPRSLFEKQSYFLWLHILALQVRRGSWALSQRGRARVWCREVASQDPGGRCRAEAVREGLERPRTDSEAQTTFLEPRQADLNATVGFCRTFFPKKNENLQGRGAGAEVSIKEELGQAHGEAPRSGPMAFQETDACTSLDAGDVPMAESGRSFHKRGAWPGTR